MSKGSFPAIVVATALLLLLSGPVSAGIAVSFDNPDTVIASNTVIEIIEHNGGIWMATGEGVNFTFDSGRTWLLYDSSNGLITNDISALYAIKGRLWVATGHSENIGGQSVGFSDALMYTDNNGQTWGIADFEGIPDVIGGDKQIFDITGHYDPSQNEDWLFFAAFAGSFLASRDGGVSWRRIYSSAADSFRYVNESQPPVQTRYFSCVTDTSHGDSLFVWTGTAGGIFQYVFAPPDQRPSSKLITDIMFCNECGPGDSSRVYFGGANGVTRGTASGGPFISRFLEDGLPGLYISRIFPFAGRVFVGTKTDVDGLSTGLAVSTDGGDSYTALSGFTDVIGPDRTVFDMAVRRDRMYLAGERAGLFVSLDTGASWTHIWVDSSDTSAANARNTVLALDVFVDTLRVGTDSGLVTLYMDSTGAIDSSRYDVFPETPGFGSARVIGVHTQVFYDSTGPTYDSLAIWTINRPLTASGSPVVLRSREAPLQDGEQDTLWQALQPEVLTNDIVFIGDTVWAVGEAGLRFSDDGSNPSKVFTIRDTTSLDEFDSEEITVMSVSGDTVIVGTNQGFAISHDCGQRYKIFRVNTDTLAADIVINHTRNSTSGQISGDFIPALGVQYLEDELARIWVSARPALTGGSQAISTGIYLPVDSGGNVLESESDSGFARYDIQWGLGYDTGFAWNFGFNGDTVFAASDNGLLFNFGDTGRTWDTVALVDADNNVLVEPDVSIFAVEVVGNSLWVGTEQATVRVGLDDFVADSTFFFVDRESASDLVYGFPVPFSHSAGGGVDFHFVLDEQQQVTLEVYDAAMNLVARVIENRSFGPGTYHGRNTGVPTWDGRNGAGDRVAVGPYYFKVELSSGDVRWGKLAVIP